MSGMCKAVYLKEGTYDCFTLPRYPWQKVGTDFFEWQGTMYLLVEDYFSRYIEIVKLSLTMSGTVESKDDINLSLLSYSTEQRLWEGVATATNRTIFMHTSALF